MAFNWKGREVKVQITNNVAAGVRELAEFVAESARSKAPVATGRLRDSIEVRIIGPNSTSATVIATAPHAPYVEYGTRRQPARPFMRPALMEAAERARQMGAK